jgi:hypothetical protein
LSAETVLAHNPSAEGEHVAGSIAGRSPWLPVGSRCSMTASDSSSFPGDRRWTATLASRYGV